MGASGHGGVGEGAISTCVSDLYPTASGSLSERLRNTIASRAGESPGRFDSCSYCFKFPFVLHHHDVSRV